MQIKKFTASVIAANFIEQYNSDVTIKDVILEGNVWRVTISIGLMKKKMVEVQIDAANGRILSYSIGV